MRKLRLYKYEHAPGHVHDEIPGYEDSVPFSKVGIAEWCDLVGPDEAELFYCGQYNDKNNWLLNPECFEHYRGNESKHVFDLEGDSSEDFFHDWMRPAIITAMNAEPNHRNWRCLVRPGCSMLLMDMVQNPRESTPAKRHGFYFRGQRDPYGVREKLRAALRESGLPHQFEFMPNWNAPTPAGHADVRRYEAEMREWSVALCPSGTGQMSVRYFEACALGRCPVVVADNLLFEDSAVPSMVGVRVDPSLTVKQMARRLGVLYESEAGVVANGMLARSHFLANVVPYFEDPTLYMLAWLQTRGLVDGDEWYKELGAEISKFLEIFS